MRHARSVDHVQFIGNGSHVITTEYPTGKWLWDLAPEPRPVIHLKQLAELLSRRTIDPIGELSPLNQQEIPLSRDELQSLWGSLRAEYPGDFSVTQEEKLNWHDRELESAESERAWPAAVFHLERLLELKPNDPLYTQRRERVTIE